ncbi:helix-turn-helix transcriptional regulator [Haliea sp. AH-315-K21]|uniref:Transcriptional regulator n=1 Tax=SAR86 cluster bacterium TaxID=2030880 RepID=A0A2A5CCJ3_9GAMM|nr:helix-turn-helix transcriptional regulator [Haliea sp. AH-315-K21]PCJ41231.1 MAG: transcriptional regulator [SAR86 cluster bacterium]
MNQIGQLTELYGNIAACPIRNVLDRLGDKWTILVVLILHDVGKIRFNKLHNIMGDISQKMLTVTLRKLEADGLVAREVFMEIPPKVEYQLTPIGESLVPHISSLSHWALENMTSILDAREKYST